MAIRPVSAQKPDRTYNIVHCFRSPVGGIFRHVRDLTKTQSEAGHRVGIVCDSSTGGAFEEEMFSALEDRLALGLVRLPMQRNIGLGDLISGWNAFRAIRSMRPDILHGHSAKGGVYSRVLGTGMRLTGMHVARIYSPHGGSLHYDGGSAGGRIIFAIESLLARLSDHLIFVSDFERNTFRKKVGETACPSTLVYNGLWDDDFAPVVTAPDAADFLYIGMMRDLKGPDIVIEALQSASAMTGRALTAVMVGDGEDRARYIQRVGDAGLGDRVEFRMPMPAREAFALGRIVVVPSRAEALPYIVLEALAAGKPMIATRVGGIPEIFGPGSPALITADPGELAFKMASVLDDEKGFSAVMPPISELRQRFGVASMARRIGDVYAQSLGSSPENPGTGHAVEEGL